MIVALAGALALEILGISTVSTALMLRDYNASKLKTDPAAPIKLAYVLTGVYLVSAQLVVLFVEIVPSVVRWVSGLFPFISLTGGVVISLRADHRRRLTAVKQAADDRKAARQGGKQGRNKQRRQPARTGIEVRQEMEIQPAYANTSDGTRNRARVILAERPGISGSELGRVLGRSERLGRKLKAELTGTIAGNNGTEAS